MIDVAYDRAAKSFADNVRARNYALVQQQVNKQVYWIGLYFRPYIVTADDRVKHFANNVVNGETWNVYSWRSRGG